MVRWMTFLAASTALAACTASPPPEVAAHAAPAEVAAPEPAPKPELGTFGFDTAGMERSILPGDNFYQYANGTWAKNTPIPEDKSNYGMFTKLDDLSKERTRLIIDEVAKDPTNKIGVAYNSYLDTAGIEAKGLQPIQPWLNEIKGLNARSGYAALVAKAGRNSISIPFGLFVGQDDKQPDRYVTAMFQGGIGMPDRDYYLSKDAKIAAVRTAYLQHLTNVLTLAGEPNAATRAKALLAFETEVAKVHWTQVDSRDATKTYNLMPLSKLNADAKGFDWATFLRDSGLSAATEVNVAQPSAINGISRLVAKAPLGVLKDQLLIRSLDQYAPVLPSAFDREAFSFYGTTLSGTPQQEVRWKRGVTFVTGALADDVSKIYVERYFPPETKAAADKLVKNVVEAMGRRIDGLSWMAPETKKRARAKLANFTTKIGYPDRWQDYSALTIQAGDALGNAMRAAQWQHEDNVKKLGEPIRRWEWGMTPMTINAYANFGMQEVVFPAAILQPPFFDPNADPAINYGGIGAVIGHEISHHFDDQGAKYDEHGRLNEWWTESDRKAFEAAGKALISQYDAYEIFPGANVKGAFTLGENIGDLAGLTVAYDAYKHSLGGAEAPVLDGTTGDQRFYLGWAQVWRRNYREANLRQRLITDPHSPSEQRTWVVRNLDPWYPAFQVQPGQKLYLAPEQRVRMW
ncbi:M13 family metallopeptidase [Sphingomonas sp. G124]|uniref:M13 family metallopeptidase n=1 Tax=Sphingomonas cremea TaxID=2904799 RepID=A0A9X1QJ37_9SPHN|nr:M13 family metallopeptidase [Sphingomonas cremea]MCF2514040.1 M13 family metallopeptidase [Sphingomonas cremea]